jgi:dTDP-4-amino-4,6-dideoxygalactose transaminase
MVTATTSIPLVDLRAQCHAIRAEIDPAIRETVDEGAFILGERVSAFEEAFAALCGARFGVGTSSGTSALHVALTAAGIEPRDEVIMPAHTFVATAEAVCHCGATPVFADVDPETLCLDPEQIEAAITPQTRAIIPVHIYGQCADMAPILATARRHDLTVVEDAAQAHGAPCGDRRAGGLGDFGCFSFYPGKNLGAFGDGGLVTTSDEEQARHLRLLINHGRTTKHSHEIIAFNYRLDALQAAILSVKLRHLESWNRARRRLAHRYSELLGDLPLQTPTERRGHVWHLYVIQCDDRDALAEALRADGIATGIHYPLPLHMQPCLQHLPSSGEGRLPVTERAARRILSLPLFPEMTDEQQDRVVAAVRRFLGG